MFNTPSTLRIAVYGAELKPVSRGIGLWSSGYHGAITAAGATPVLLSQAAGDESWDEILEGVQGVVVAGFGATGFGKDNAGKMGDAESLCLWCKQHRFPILAIDQGLLALNAAYGGLNYGDLCRELPEALQHRHPPEPGLRHAIMVQPDTQMSRIYGEGEIVVNSEHRQAIQRLANGFEATAIALDGVIEAIEFKNENWFALGVQWQPAASTASGLDIQVFRALIDAAVAGSSKPAGVVGKPQRLAMAG